MNDSRRLDTADDSSDDDTGNSPVKKRKIMNLAVDNWDHIVSAARIEGQYLSWSPQELLVCMEAQRKKLLLQNAPHSEADKVAAHAACQCSTILINTWLQRGLCSAAVSFIPQDCRFCENIFTIPFVDTTNCVDRFSLTCPSKTTSFSLFFYNLRSDDGVLGLKCTWEILRAFATVVEYFDWLKADQYLQSICDISLLSVTPMHPLPKVFGFSGNDIVKLVGKHAAGTVCPAGKVHDVEFESDLTLVLCNHSARCLICCETITPPSITERKYSGSFFNYVTGFNFPLYSTPAEENQRFIFECLSSPEGVLQGVMKLLVSEYKNNVYCLSDRKTFYWWDTTTCLWGQASKKDIVFKFHLHLKSIFNVFINHYPKRKEQLIRLNIVSLVEEALNSIVSEFIDVNFANNLNRGQPFILPIFGKLMLDLRDGSTRVRTSTDYFTFESPVAPLPAAAPLLRAEKFFSTLFGDADSVSFAQRVLGYLLTGYVRERKFFILYAPVDDTSTSLNSLGSRALVKVLQTVMGDLACKESVPSLFGPVQSIPVSSSALRLSVSHQDETGTRNMRWGGCIASVTDPLSLTYAGPTCQLKLVVGTNQVLPIRSQDPLASAACILRLLPLEKEVTREWVHITCQTAVVDSNSKAVLEEGYLSELFTWIVRGAQLYLQESQQGVFSVLNSPASNIATQDMFTGVSNVFRYVKALEGQNALTNNVNVIAFYKGYELWCNTSSHTVPLSRAEVAKLMEAMGYHRKKSSTIRWRREGTATFSEYWSNRFPDSDRE